LGKGLITIEETLAMVFSRRQLIDRDYRSPFAKHPERSEGHP
jgi:hypothetical protein